MTAEEFAEEIFQVDRIRAEPQLRGVSPIPLVYALTILLGRYDIKPKGEAKQSAKEAIAMLEKWLEEDPVDFEPINIEPIRI